jgi:hypothetical protein
MIAVLIEVQHEVEIIACHLPPIAYRIWLKQIWHLLHTRDRGRPVLVNRFRTHSARDRRQAGDEWQDSQNGGPMFHSQS